MSPSNRLVTGRSSNEQRDFLAESKNSGGPKNEGLSPILLYSKETVSNMSVASNEIGDSPNRFFSSVYDMSNVCRGCGKNEFIDDEQTGDRICLSCGEVQLSNLLSEEPEWRTFKEEGMLKCSLFIGRKRGG